MVNGDWGLHDCMRTKKVGDCMQAMAMYDVLVMLGWLVACECNKGARLLMYDVQHTRLFDFAFECNLLVRSQGLLECVLGAWEVRNCLHIRDMGCV